MPGSIPAMLRARCEPPWAATQAASLNWVRRWQVRHVCADPPNPRFLIDDAKSGRDSSTTSPLPGKGVAHGRLNRGRKGETGRRLRGVRQHRPIHHAGAVRGVRADSDRHRAASRRSPGIHRRYPRPGGGEPRLRRTGRSLQPLRGARRPGAQLGGEHPRRREHQPRPGRARHPARPAHRSRSWCAIGTTTTSGSTTFPRRRGPGTTA